MLHSEYIRHIRASSFAFSPAAFRIAARSSRQAPACMRRRVTPRSFSRARRSYNIIKAQVKAADRSRAERETGGAISNDQKEKETFFTRNANLLSPGTSTWQTAPKTRVVVPSSRCLIRQCKHGKEAYISGARGCRSLGHESGRIGRHVYMAMKDAFRMRVYSFVA